MISISNRKKEKYKNKKNREIELLAIIVRGNRQVIEHLVKASKRFVYEDMTYVIKKDCIFTTKYMGLLKPCSVFTEGNPNPYDFKIADENIPIESYLPEYDLEDENEVMLVKQLRDYLENTYGKYIAKKGEMIPNLGLKSYELDVIYGEILYEILVRIQNENKMVFLFLFGFITLALTVLMVLGVIFGVVL